MVSSDAGDGLRAGRGRVGGSWWMLVGLNVGCGVRRLG